MGRLELQLLGVPRVVLDGREVTFRTRKTLALLVFLATEGGMHHRDKLAELLWPASTGRRGRTALRSALAGIRRVLGEGTIGAEDGLLMVEGDLLGVDAGPGLHLDLDVLRGASEASRAVADAGGTNGDPIPALRSADAAYRGEFMQGFSLGDAPEFDLWLDGQRALWRARIGGVTRRLADLEAESGDLAAAAAIAGRWVVREPAEEAARLRLVQARSAAGDPEGALAAHEGYRSYLRPLGTEPGPETEALAARIRARAGASVSGGEEGRPPAAGPSRMPFVGRGAEFGALVAEYRAARSGAVRAAVVIGEAGIGKTRLVEEFLSWATSRGADALSGGTFEAGRRLPYGPLVDALRPRIERERAPDDLLGDRWLAELSRILPELRDRYPDLPAPTADEASARAVLFEAVARLGAALAGGTDEPLILFLDDLQWADGAALDALLYCCRCWARDGVPLLLLMTAREEDLGTNALGRWLSSLGRELTVRRLELASVSEGDIDGLLRLLGGAASPGDDGASAQTEPLGRWLWEESDGHPLFLAQILGVLLQRGVLAERIGPDGQKEIVLPGEGFDEGALRGLVPAGLRELIRDKLHPLPDAAADVLTAGAVLGQRFGFAALLGVAGVGESEGLGALDGLVSARLLEEGGPAPEEAYSFAHDKIREVAYTEAGEARREVFHRRALGHLEDEGAPAAELARHALAAGLSGEAFGHLLSAAEGAIAVFAAGDAVSFYERARVLLEGPTPETATADNEDGHQFLRLYGGLAQACALIHDWVGAREAYEGMLAVAREAGDRESEWEALYGLGMLNVGFTVGPDDDELLRGVRRRVALEKRPEHANSGGIHSPRVACRYAESALRLAHDLDREDLIFRSEFVLGVDCAWAGMWEEAATHLEETLSLCPEPDYGEMEPQDLVQLISSRGLVTWSRALVDGPDDAFGPTGILREHWRETAEICHALGTDYFRAQLGAQAQGLVMAGEYEDAIRRTSRGFEAARSLGHPQFAFLCLQGLGNAYAETFALGAARSAYSEMLDWVTFSVIEKHIHARLCAAAALGGEWERAHGHALEAIGLAEELYLPPPYLHRHHDIEALLRGGDAELARKDLRTFERRTRGQKGYFRLAYLRSAAVLARWDGEAEETLSLLRGALGEAERLGLPGEVWQVGAALGGAHEERGEIGPSEEAYGRAAAVIRRLASNVPDGELREGYLAAPQTRRVLERAPDASLRSENGAGPSAEGTARVSTGSWSPATGEALPGR